jgi:hypothetical protein
MRRTIDGRADMGMRKYRSMMARMSAAYADIAPEEAKTLHVSSGQSRSRWKLT